MSCASNNIAPVMAWNRGIGNLGSAESTPTNTRPYDTHKEKPYSRWISNHNAVLIALHPAQKDRKQMLDGFVAAYRIKFPRLQLVL